MENRRENTLEGGPLKTKKEGINKKGIKCLGEHLREGNSWSTFLRSSTQSRRFDESRKKPVTNGGTARDESILVGGVCFD